VKASDFYFELPASLIAQYPPPERGQSRLMLLERRTGLRTHRMVQELPEILTGPDFLSAEGRPPLLVFNNSKVRKARLLGRALETGASVEFLLIEKMSPDHCLKWKTLVQRAKRRRPGSSYAFFDSDNKQAAQAEITGGEGEFRFLQFDRPIDEDWLDRYGHVPLPPYIRRVDAPSDAERYQTVYAQVPGSAAAPTAGLHFTRELLGRIEAAGVESVFITLNVGLGTFLPVRSENVEDHKMHEELFSIDEEAAEKIEKVRVEGRRIIAVGTTSLRALESACRDDSPGDVQKEFFTTEEHGVLRRKRQKIVSNFKLSRGEQATSIFIYPGYKFKAVDCLFTNFHTPESTLLMLVSAFAESALGDVAKTGRELILECYAQAIREGFRFFSYGDAMLIV
jgi:S-adenosylmethionine:tRNA ribosyltransferase-isomerase